MDDQKSGRLGISAQRELTLKVSQTEGAGNLLLVYELSSTKPEDELNTKRFELTGSDVRSLAASEIDQISQADTSHAGSKAEDVGQNLAAQLLPGDLRSRLHQLSEKTDTSLWIQEKSPWVPWNLLCLENRDSQGKKSSHLADLFDCSYWVLEQGFVTRLRRHSLALLIADPGKQKGIAKELNYIINLENRFGCRVEQFQLSEETWRRVVNSKKYDIIHVIAHGMRDEQQLGMCKIASTDWQSLSFNTLPGGDLNGALLFLNVCGIAEASVASANVNGWAMAALKARAGAFVGPCWKVDDCSAAVFAEYFYDHFLSGAPISFAVRKARLNMKEAVSRDADRLAYVVFAHPAARCELFSNDKESEFIAVPSMPEVIPESEKLVAPDEQLQIRARAIGAERFEWNLVDGHGKISAEVGDNVIYYAPSMGGCTDDVTVRAFNKFGASPAAGLRIRVLELKRVPISALGIPAGWMCGEGDPSRWMEISNAKDNCYTGHNCLRIRLKKGAGWGGFFWWPTTCGESGTEDAWARVKAGTCGIDVLKAGDFSAIKRLSFWARGERGGEVVEFKVGASDILPKPGRSTGKLELTADWTHYEIDLARVDMSNVIGLFAWIAAEIDNPEGAQFYLDDVEIEGLK